MAKKPNPSYNKPNFWGMIQNIMIASMRSGYAIIATIFLLLLIAVLKLDSTQIVTWINNIGDSLKFTSGLGWCLLIISIIVFERRMKKMRVNHSNEMDRITEEKKYLQEKLTQMVLPKTKNR